MEPRSLSAAQAEPQRGERLVFEAPNTGHTHTHSLALEEVQT